MAPSVTPATTRQARASAGLEALQAAGLALHRDLETIVHTQRLAGASWTAVARLLGVTRQSAHRRWRYLDDLGVDLVVAPDGGSGWHGRGSGCALDAGMAGQVARHGLVLDYPAATLAVLSPEVRAALPAAAA